MRPLSFITLILAFLATILLAPQANADKGAEIERLRREELSMSFAFYGKVTDLEGNPVPDAEVSLRVRHVPLLPILGEQKHISRTTDEQGRFSADGEGYLLAVDKIEKSGYEYDFRDNPERIFRFDKNKKKLELGQLPNQPITFKIRKKNLPTLVLGANARFSLELGGRAAFFDLLWQQWGFPDNLLGMNMTYKGWQPDLKIYLEGDRKDCQLVVEAIDADTGLVEDRRKQFEVPLSGYKPKVVIPIPKFDKGDGVKTFVYVKGRGGKFYSRMDILLNVGIHFDSDKRYGRMNIDYRTNPNGERSLEVDKKRCIKHSEDVSAGRVRPYGYDPDAKGLSIEDVRKLLGK